jgi:hypothetical protein
MRAAFLATLMILSSLSVAAQTQEKLAVFVAGVGTDGFTDPSKARQDSAKDLAKKITGSKTLRLVQTVDEAVAVLTVLDRVTVTEHNGFAAFSGQGQNRSALTVRLTAGEYSTEFSGASGSKGVMTGYGAAAGQVVKQLEEWVKANHAKLVAAR